MNWEKNNYFLNYIFNFNTYIHMLLPFHNINQANQVVDTIKLKAPIMTNPPL